ncbi:MAG: MlaD family protein [Planctomycetes bacterium]|nr:MlaD family protein [Planctomycetota bacterium]
MTRDFLVGLLFLLALVLLGAMTMLAGNIRLFATTDTIEVRFDEISGLQEGDPVRVRGKSVGEVRATKLVPGGVMVTMELEPDLRPQEGASLQVRSASALGGSYIDYRPGAGPAIDPQTLRGTGSMDFLAVAGEIMQENRSDLRDIVQRLANVIEDLEAGQGLLGAWIQDEEIAQRFREIVDRVDSIASKIDEGDGPLGKLLNDKDVAAALERIPTIVSNIDDITGAINSGEGPLAALIHDRGLTEALQGIAADIRERKGLLGKLIGDPELAESFENVLEEIRITLRDLREGEGIIAHMLSDPEWAADVQEILANFRDASARLNRADNTIGRLLNSDELYLEAVRTVTLLRDVTEDAREQAPINAFLRALFQAF